MHRAARLALACLALAAAGVLFLRLPAVSSVIQDDGFIYFRIASNAARGLGPVFNPGDRVDAATSPVWVWLLSAAARTGAPIPAAACILGILAWLGAVLVAARWALELATAHAVGGHPRAPRAAAELSPGERITGWWPAALVGAVILVADPRHLFYAGSGMETSLAALSWLVATRALVRSWFEPYPERRAGWWALAATLVRPEYVLFIAGLAAAALWRRSASRRVVLRTLLPVVAGGAVYLLAHGLYFGDPFPNTWRAKRAGDWAHTRIGLAYLAGLPRSHPWIFAGFAALLVPRLRRLALGVLSGLLLYSLHVTSLGGDHFVFQRPFIIVLPLLLAVGSAAGSILLRSSRAPARAATVVCIVAALLGAAVQRVPPLPFEWVRNAAQMGHALARTYPPGTRVGLFAIGATGYTAGLPVVDALGLADRHVAGRDLSHEHVCHLDIGHERGDPEYVLQQADVIVPFGAFAPARFESLSEVREGFYSQKKFLAAAERAVADGRFRIQNVEFAPGAYWLVLEKMR